MKIGQQVFLILKNFVFLQQTYNGPLTKTGGIEPLAVDLQRLKIQETTRVRLVPLHPPDLCGFPSGDWGLGACAPAQSLQPHAVVSS